MGTGGLSCDDAQALRPEAVLASACQTAGLAQPSTDGINFVWVGTSSGECELIESLDELLNRFTALVGRRDQTECRRLVRLADAPSAAGRR
jgi:hypothetical protein